MARAGGCQGYLLTSKKRLPTLILMPLESGSVTSAQYQFYRQSDGSLKDVQYTSLVSGKSTTIKVDRILGVSSATVFKSTDSQYAVKVYDVENPHALYMLDYRYNFNEVMMTRFFRTFDIPVAEIVDVSDSIVGFRNPYVVVIKKYVPGIPFDKLQGLDDDHNIFNERSKLEILEELKQQRDWAVQVFKDRYLDWFYMQPELRLHGAFLKPLAMFDNFNSNWIYTANGWVLIDP